MKAISIILILAASVGAAEIVLRFSDGYYVVANRQLVKAVFVDLTGDDDGDDGGGGDTLEDKVREWVKTVNDPGTASRIATGYLTAAKSLRSGALKYEQALKAVKAFRSVATMTPAQKKAWAPVFAKIDEAVAAAPKTADTIEAVGKGLGNPAQPFIHSNIDWLKLITCIIQSFIGSGNSLEQAIDAVATKALEVDKGKELEAALTTVLRRLRGVAIDRLKARN